MLKRIALRNLSKQEPCAIRLASFFDR